MDTYLAFHREKNENHRLEDREKASRLNHKEHPSRNAKWDKPDPHMQDKNSRWAKPDQHEKGFNPTFPSLQDLSNDSQRANKDFFNTSPTSPYQMGRDIPSDEALNQIRTANSLTISPELFEKIYLNPSNNVKGDLRQTFGNPTPLALLGFLLSLSPLSCELMGWRGAGGNGVATIGAYYFIGGFLMSLGGILEFFLGNTFSFVVFCSFGGFWFTLGGTLTPSFNAYGAYVADASGLPSGPNDGITSPGFHASFGFFLLFMGLMCLIYLICALRTNLVFVAIFLGLLLTFVVLTGSYWHLAQGHADVAQQLQVAAGAFGFMAVMAGWWIFFAQMLASVDFPFEIPVGDISHLIKPMSEKKAMKDRYPAAKERYSA